MTRAPMEDDERPMARPPLRSELRPVASQNGLSLRQVLLGIAGIVILISIVNGPARIVPTPAAAVDRSWIPAGFTSYTGDDDLAFQWSDHPICTYSSGTCWALTAVTRSGCPNSLYVELSLTDAAGTAVGYTNDVAGAVLARQQARLTFDTFNKTATDVRITKMSCY